MPIGYRGHNPKRDANEPDIIEAWESIGGQAHRLSDPNIPDLLIGIQGKTVLCEVKSKGGQLTEGQRQWIEDWQDYGGWVVIAYSADDVYAYARERGWIDL